MKIEEVRYDWGFAFRYRYMLIRMFAAYCKKRIPELAKIKKKRAKRREERRELRAKGWPDWKIYNRYQKMPKQKHVIDEDAFYKKMVDWEDRTFKPVTTVPWKGRMWRLENMHGVSKNGEIRDMEDHITLIPDMGTKRFGHEWTVDLRIYFEAGGRRGRAKTVAYPLAKLSALRIIEQAALPVGAKVRYINGDQFNARPSNLCIEIKAEKPSKKKRKRSSSICHTVGYYAHEDRMDTPTDIRINQILLKEAEEEARKRERNGH